MFAATAYTCSMRAVIHRWVPISLRTAVIAQPAKAGRYGGVFTEIENAVGLLFEPAVMAQGVKPFHVRVLS